MPVKISIFSMWPSLLRNSELCCCSNCSLFCFAIASYSAIVSSGSSNNSVAVIHSRSFTIVFLVDTLSKQELFFANKTPDQDAPHETSPHRHSTGSSRPVLQHLDQDMGDHKCSIDL
nr:hypothetical protein CR513_29546 [Ipomoea trifida]